MAKSTQNPNAMPLLNMLADQHRRVPLAEALRPKTLEDYLGQHAVVGEGTPLRNLIDTRQLTSLIFWGPPGVGKTTLARLIANHSDARFIELSAVNSGVKELREAVAEAQEELRTTGRQTVVFIDEIHRYSKTQQDGILPYVENGTIVLMGATTENPSFQVISPLLSRVLVIRLEHLGREQMMSIIGRGIRFLSQSLGPIAIAKSAMGFIVDYANGDGRSALTLLEVAALCAPIEVIEPKEGAGEAAPAGDNQPQTGKQAAPAGASKQKVIRIELLEQLAQQNRLNYDRQGDEHYDHASAYQKSLRGSDPDAAIYWLAKMLAAGEDPRFAARRLLVTASEDVGNADSQAFLIAQAAFDAVERLGMPECRIALAQATIYVAKAPKSNAAICAIDDAMADILHKGHSYSVPKHLRDAHYSDAKEKYGHGVGYVYSHAHPDAPQQFLPDELVELGRKYVD